MGQKFKFDNAIIGISDHNIDWKLSHIQAKLSQIAYIKFENEKSKLELALIKEKLQLVDTFSDSKTGTQAFLAKAQDEYYLAFRGTEQDGIDILTDLKARLVVTGFHTGFYQGFESVKKRIDSQIPDKCRLNITGHSLGGALATIAASYFSKKCTVSCYTYGAPPVGTKDIFEYDNNDHLFRFIHRGDIVPRAMLVGPIAVYLIIAGLNIIKWALLRFGNKADWSVGWLEFLDAFNKDIVKYEHPQAGIYLFEGGLFEINEKRGHSLEIFFTVLFKNSKQVFEDHKIADYISSIGAIGLKVSEEEDKIVINEKANGEIEI